MLWPGVIDHHIVHGLTCRILIGLNCEGVLMHHTKEAPTDARMHHNHITGRPFQLGIETDGRLELHLISERSFFASSTASIITLVDFLVNAIRTIQSISNHRTVASVTQPERSKGTKDEVSRPQGPPTRTLDF